MRLECNSNWRLFNLGLTRITSDLLVSVKLDCIRDSAVFSRWLEGSKGSEGVGGMVTSGRVSGYASEFDLSRGQL